MADGDYPGMMTGYPGMPQPGYAPSPSAFGYAMGAFGGPPLGFGGPSQQQQVQAGGMAAGLGTLNFATGTAPAMLGMGATAAGVAGGFLEIGGASRLTRGLGWGMNFLDPFSAAFEMGGRGGLAAGGRGMAFGASRGMGMAGQYAMGGAFGLAGGIMAAAIPAAVAYGGYKAVEYAGNQMWQGGQNLAAGQALANQLGPAVAPGQNMMGQGAGMASMLRDVSASTKVGTEDLGRLAQEFTAAKLFQTTRDMKEFKEKFTATMKAVKEIAQVTQSTIDEAAKMFMDLRQQGFYQTADIKAQAAVNAARASASGLSYENVNAVGGAGAGMARQYGMRAKAGADLATQNLAGLSMGMRAGTISEELIMENGGLDQVAMRQSQQQMGFLGSSRGRAIIAAMMGKGGAPDPGKLQAFMGGNTSLEDLVTRAAGSGLGTLMQAGTRESKEAMMPYAGMAMVSMAASQQQQLFGSVDQRGLTRMLGTMGLSRDDSAMLLQQTRGLPEQLRREQIQKDNDLNRVNADEMERRQSFSGRWGRQTRNTREYLQDAGAGLLMNVSGVYSRTVEGYSGGKEYRGGDDRLLKEAFAGLRNGSLGTGRGSTSGASESWFGLSPSEDLRDSYSQFSKSGADIMRGRSGTLAEAVASGAIRDLGREGVLGERKYVDNKVMDSVRQSREDGLNAAKFDEKTQARLDMAMADQTTREKLIAARKVNMGPASGFRSSVWGAADAAGLAGSRYQDIRAMEQESDTFELAKEAGIISKDATYTDYIHNKVMGADGKPINREKLRGQMATQAKRTGGALGREFDDVRAGGSGAQDLESLRASSKARTDEFINRHGSKRFYGAADFGATSQARDLGAELDKNGEARDKFTAFTRSIGNLDPTNTDSMTELLNRKNELLASVPAGSNAAKEIEDMFSRARSDPGYRKDVKTSAGEGTALDREYKERALGEALAGQGKKATAVAKDMLSGKIAGSVGMRDLVTGVASASGKTPLERLRSTEALTRAMLSEDSLGGKGIDQNELDILTRIGIGGGGSKFGQALNAGLAGEAKKFKELTGKDLSRDELAAFQTGDTSKIMKILNDHKLSVDELAGSSVGEVSQQGSDKDYVEANTRFVQTVDAFISRWGKAVGINPEGGELINMGTSENS